MHRNPARRLLIVTLTLSLAGASSASAQSWTELHPLEDPVSGVPEGGQQTAGVFDPATNQMIVFGGAIAPTGPFVNTNAVWRLTGANGLGEDPPAWIKVAPDGPSPAPRRSPRAVYDSVNNRMIVFGGGKGATSPCTNEVWVLDNANGLPANPAWIRLSPSGGSPAPRIHLSAVYDQANNRLIVYGGYNCFSAATYGDVWVLDNANGMGGTPAWTQLTPSGGAPNRDSHEAFYDPGTNRMIVFGGRTTAPGLRNDVWVLTNANGLGGAPSWYQVAPTGPLPSPRAVVNGAYDEALNQFFIFGGTGPENQNEVWVLSNANDAESAAPAWSSTRSGRSLA